MLNQCLKMQENPSQRLRKKCDILLVKMTFERPQGTESKGGLLKRGKALYRIEGEGGGGPRVGRGAKLRKKRG